MRTTSPTTVTLQALPAGDAAVAATLAHMARYVNAAKRDYRFVALARSIVAGLRQKDYRGEAARIHAFVRDRIRYVRDIRGIETLQTPEKTLEIGQGDCDDKSTLLATLLEVIGHPTRFVAVGIAPSTRISHVYVETRLGNRWVPAETTEPWPFGKGPSNISIRKVYHL